MSLIDEMFAQAERDASAAVARKRKASAGVALPLAEQRDNPYLPSRLIAVFHRLHCIHCGSVQDQFEGLFEERRHVRLSDLHMVRQPFMPASDNTLPRVRQYYPHDIPYCNSCSNLSSYMEP